MREMATPIPTNVASFSVRDVLVATGGVLQGAIGHDAMVVGVCTDTRVLAPKQLYVALSGDQFDGHDHLAAAAARGALIALVERDIADAPVPVVRVASTLDALGALAACHVERWREATGGRVAVLTGSAGKTTTKTVLGALAEAAAPGKTLVTRGNLNNRIGVPMTVFGLTEEHRYAVLELGTNVAGEIAALSRIARADVGLITLIAAAHTEGLGDIDAVEREKGDLFEGLAPDGIAVGNVDDERVLAALERANSRERVTYGTAEGANYRIQARTLLSPYRQRVDMSSPRGDLTFECPLLGATGALACAAALAVCDALRGCELDDAAMHHALLRASEELSDRMAPRELKNGTWVIDDSYNANPASCRASIATAKELADHLSRRLVLVLGEMRELGDRSVAEHRALGGIAAAHAQLVICVGGDAEHAWHEATARATAALFVEDSGEAAKLARARVQPGDVVLVKGSRGVRTERVVRALMGDAA
jgi:UDP-N-acetylmuramoyl-tripeptide--D-alanyl-D-alanine ligase